MKKLKALEVATIKMQCGELKLNLLTLKGSQKFSTSWIDLSILPVKLDKYVKLFQQVLLNSDIRWKSRSTLNLTARQCEDTFCLHGR